MTPSGLPSVLVACPDARPPAYQAVVGLHRAGLLQSFRTAYYYRGEGSLNSAARLIAPQTFAKCDRLLRRRHHADIPGALVRSDWGYDIAIRLEGRLAGWSVALRRAVAKSRTRHFDGRLARAVDRERPDAALVFSDVGSECALPTCRDLGIPTVLSMVHGDVREERQVLEREFEASPDHFRMYLGDGALDLDELGWLHDRRLRELETATRVLVPSDHIAETLVSNGTPASKVRVVPYAADTRRFRPDPAKRHGRDCTFLFAGGISQRKGIRYLLEAWRRVRRAGWRLQLLGAMPRDPGPLKEHLGEVEWLGRVPHSGVPAVMAAADVFVFPSLFEGSAVVTYEALACGLPSVVTPNAGSVVRDGRDGFLVPSGAVEPLADRMEGLGRDPELRAEMAVSARAWDPLESTCRHASLSIL